MLIDIHAHFGTLGPSTVTPAQLAEYAAVVGLSRVFVSCLDAAGGDGGRDLDEPDANVAALDAAAAHGVLAPLYWIRPGQPDSNIYAFIGAMKTEPFAGVVLAPRLNGFSIDDERLDDWMRIAAKLNRPVLVLCGRDERSRPQRGLALARRHPSVDFILTDFGGEMVWREALDAARAGAERAAARIFLTTSHRTQEDLKAAAKSIGHDRLLFGTNALAGGADAIATARELMTSVKAAFGETHAAAVLGNTAARLFGVSPPAAVRR